MKKTTIILCSLLLLIGLGMGIFAYLFFSEVKEGHKWLHLPSQQHALVRGSVNSFVYPVIEGIYMIRIGNAEINNPVMFPFSVSGEIVTKGEVRAIDKDTYVVDQKVLDKEIDGGCLSYRVCVTSKTDNITADIKADYPEGKQLYILFHPCK